MNTTRWCLRLISLIVLMLWWHNSLAIPFVPKATMPPPTATHIAPEELDTLSYLAGANAGAMLKHQGNAMGITSELFPELIGGFRQYWQERNTPQRLAYNTGIIIVPEVINLLRAAETHALANDSISQLSLPHFAQGIEEALHHLETLPAPENELEQWVEGQLLALKNNYTPERAEQLSYALGRVAITAGYISTLIHGYGADSTYLTNAIRGITDGLRNNTPHEIARYMGLRLGQEGWEILTMTELILLGKTTTPEHLTHLSPKLYLDGFTDMYQGTLRLTDTQGQPLTREACATLYSERLRYHSLNHYKQAQHKAQTFWQQLRKDSTIVWLDEHTAYRIEMAAGGSKPTPNQRITATLTPLDSLLNAIETPNHSSTKTTIPTIRNQRLNSVAQPLRSILATAPLGSTIIYYTYDSSANNINPEILSAKLPEFFSIYRIQTKQTATANRTTKGKSKTSSKKKKAPRRR